MLFDLTDIDNIGEDVRIRVRDQEPLHERGKEMRQRTPQAVGAVRNPDNEYHRYEASIVTEHPTAAKMIARVREQLKLRRSQPPD